MCPLASFGLASSSQFPFRFGDNEKFAFFGNNTKLAMTLKRVGRSQNIVKFMYGREVAAGAKQFNANLVVFRGDVFKNDVRFF